MNINRREFIVLTVSAAASCAAPMTQKMGSPVGISKTIDAGLATDYGRDGAYGGFRQHGVLIVRQGEHLKAISSECTHRACILNIAEDQSFFCKCHGSTFARDGKVTKGPAKVDLPEFKTSIDGRGHLLVHIS